MFRTPNVFFLGKSKFYAIVTLSISCRFIQVSASSHVSFSACHFDMFKPDLIHVENTASVTFLDTKMRLNAETLSITAHEVLFQHVMLVEPKQRAFTNLHGFNETST